MHAGGIGGYHADDMLSTLQDMTQDVVPIQAAEYRARIRRAQQQMQAQGIDLLYLNAGTNLYYFTGTRWRGSERLVGALLTASGDLHYIAPAFEEGTLRQHCVIEGAIHCWQEHESPYYLVATLVSKLGFQRAQIGIDESTPFFITDGLQQQLPNSVLCNGTNITAACRQCKSENELALMQQAKNMTLAVQKATAGVLYEGISVEEVTAFIHRAHQRVGAVGGSSFCIVLFGEDSAYPHGVPAPKRLEQNDMVLIDTGCLVEGYQADITRSYVYGEASQYQRTIWAIEKEAQAAAFAAARPGSSCGSVDHAARQVLEAHGLGPEYQLPGLPHRTGHGIGLDIHEWPYLVKDNDTPLATGMCFSNEPMICIPGQFGVRLEDHFYVTETGACWFTQPSLSIDQPFGEVEV